MWAYALRAPRTFERVEVATPTASDLGAGQVLLKTLAGGLCGSDLPFFRGQLPLPWGTLTDPAAARVPGFPMHEVVGEVVASTTSDLQPGTRVVGWASSSNALAEFVITQAAGLLAYDPSLDPAAAITLQPLACVLEAVQRTPGVSGRNVAVMGLGPIGLLFGHVLRSSGARTVRGIDRVDRSDVARDYGFDETIHATTDSWVHHLPDADRPDVVVEAIGHQQSTLGHAIASLAPEGVLFYFGIPDDVNYSLPLQVILRKNLTLLAGTTLRRRAALSLAAEYLRGHPGLAERYVTTRYAISDVTNAYEAAITPRVGQVKVVLEMT